MRPKRLWTRFFPCLLLAVSLALPGSLLSAPETPATGEAMITMDFQDVELPVLVKFISELTGKNFILDEKVKGKKVTIISPTKISKEEAYRVFESILDIKGLTTVPSGKVIKILPTKEATSQSLRTVVRRRLTVERYLARNIRVDIEDTEAWIAACDELLTSVRQHLRIREIPARGL